jgi:hypothetical protein
MWELDQILHISGLAVSIDMLIVYSDVTTCTAKTCPHLLCTESLLQVSVLTIPANLFFLVDVWSITKIWIVILLHYARILISMSHRDSHVLW